MATHAATSTESIESFRLASLRSERGRVLGMAALFGAFAALGFFRIFRPLWGMPDVGLAVAVLSVIFVLVEVGALVHVNRLIRDGLTKPCPFLMSLAVVETLFPLLAMTVLLQYDGIDPAIMPIGPGYAVFFLLLMLSTLRAEPRVAIIVGTVSVVGYFVFLCVLLTKGMIPEDTTIPRAVYFTSVVVLIIGAVVSWFVTKRVQNYIRSVAQAGDLRAERDRVNRDLDAAREVQQRLLPDAMPQLEGYDLAAFSRSADQTGGDYYDWQAIDDTRVILSIADVTGHGIGPALVTAACRAYVRATVHGDRVPAEVIRRVDGLLSDDMPAGRFVTFALVDLDTAAHRGLFLSAGHGPSFYVRADGDDIASIESQGLPLGLGGMDMLEDPITFEFAPGDVLVLFSDGFFEWADSGGDQFGIERLSEVIVAHRAESAAKIIAAMDEAILAHAADIPQPDDMTAVVIKRL